MSETCIFIFLLFLTFQCVNITGYGQCDPLTFDGLITCENSRSTRATTNPCTRSQPVGTIARYTCKPHYVLVNEDSTLISGDNNNVLKCGENGSWIGYERFKSAICQEDCGRRLTNPKPLIVNGKPTNSSIWPWHVAIFLRKNSDFDYICGGTIISRSSILTVAHCVTDSSGSAIQPNSIIIVLGAFSSNFTENRLGISTQIIEVKKIYVSENYDAKKEFQADIAVVHLSQNIEYTDHVSPICLPNDFSVDTNAIKPGTLGDVVGFGIDENGQIAQNLKHGVLEIESNTECFLSLDRILSESQLCAGSPRDDVRVTVCNGDSGGGLIRPSMIDQKYYIHGLVSTGDPNPRKRICQSHAVFTRVYTFIFWIRDILKELKDNVLHLGSGHTFLHRQSGTEEERGRFFSINQEWKNKVTDIELSYVDIDPEILLKSLDYSRTVQSINFTNVKFTKQFPQHRRLFLPLLKTFSLDILKPDWPVLTEEHREFPITLSKQFLRSLVFFEKDVEEGNPDIGRIPLLKTNLDICVHIFKLLKIHHEEGTIVLSHIPFSNEILSNIPPDFRLKYLALSRTHLIPSLLANCNLVKNIETLVLDEITGIQNHKFSQNLKNLSGLNEFVFVSTKSDKKCQIPLNSLPKSLKHLALTMTLLRIDDEVNQVVRNRRQVWMRTGTHSTSILFPDHTPNINLRNKFNDLDTFYCDSCLSDDILNSLHILSRIFPKLRGLVLKIDPNLNISITTTTLENFKNLEYALVNLSGSIKLFSKKYSTWHVKSLKNSHEFSHLEYVFNRKANFWSSEADYTVGKRVSSFENLAFKSRNYRFNGGYKTRRDFLAIPKQIQERLHTIQIDNTGFSKKVLEESIQYAQEVRHLRITNVSFFDNFIGKLVELPNLVEYKLEHDRHSVIKFFNFRNLATILSNFLPNWIPFSQDKGINFKMNLLLSKVNKYQITYGQCVLVSWNKMDGSLTSTVAYTNEWLKNTNKSILINKLVFQYWELDPMSVPSTISHLNLNFAIVKNIGMILQRLSGLNTLKLINVRVNDDEGNYKDWDWIQINMQDLSKHSETMEYLAIEKSHLRNFSPGMTFEKVKFVYLESCTFEKNFVRNFISTFPNLKRLVILGGNDSRIQIYLDVIILTALRSQTLEWILMSKPVSGSSTNSARKEINIILNRIGTFEKDDSKYFILERSSNSESWNRNSSLDESMIELELLLMKGVTDIGIDPQCHASSYLVETNRGNSTVELFSSFFQDVLN